MEDLVRAIAAKQARLLALRPLSQAALLAVQKAFDVELTYTSNAIEGNTLTLRETAELIEHGLTVGGKPLRDHLEALDHYDAVLWMRELAAGTVPVGELAVREMHRRIVARSQPEIAGIYSTLPRRIAGSSVIFPNAAKIPELMLEYGKRLLHIPGTPEAIFDAHFGLTAIHPFSDGNGRTARLFMNLLLLRADYLPIAIGPGERKEYLDALEQGSAEGHRASFQVFMHRRLDATFDQYLRLIAPAEDQD